MARRPLINLQDFLEHVQLMRSDDFYEKVAHTSPQLARFFEERNPRLLRRIESIILSMTIFERRNPRVLKLSLSRRARVAVGSGVPMSHIDDLLQHFFHMQHYIDGLQS